MLFQVCQQVGDVFVYQWFVVGDMNVLYVEVDEGVGYCVKFFQVEDLVVGKELYVFVYVVGVVEVVVICY